MTVAVVTAEDLAALQAEVQKLRERVDALEARPTAPVKPAADWMSPADYAEHRGLSERTISKFIKQGMPSKKIGKARRIDVTAANEWLADRGTT